MWFQDVMHFKQFGWQGRWCLWWTSIWPCSRDSSEDIEEEEDEDFRDTTDNLE